MKTVRENRRSDEMRRVIAFHFVRVISRSGSGDGSPYCALCER